MPAAGSPKSSPSYYRDELAETDDAGTWRSREQWAALERLALTDRVTGLFNRHAGELALEREVARARRTRAPFSLVLIDVDHFKQVNDRHGHAAGDEVLKQVSSILTSTFRASDLAVRWGGDEFLVFLPDVPVGGAMVFAERARTQVEALFFDSVGAVTLSAGIVQVRPDEDARAAVRRADAQLYEAKRSGRNLVKMAAPRPECVSYSGTMRAIPAQRHFYRLSLELPALSPERRNSCPISTQTVRSPSECRHIAIGTANYATVWHLGHSV